MNRMFRIAAFLITVGVLFVTTGCSTVPPPIQTGQDLPPVTSGTGLTAATNSRFEDVPVPEGFTVNLARSFVYQDGDLEVGFIEYRARRDYTDTINFYRVEMPRLGWDWERDVQSGNGFEMAFSKPGKKSIVRLSTSRFANTTIFIILVPTRS